MKNLDKLKVFFLIFTIILTTEVIAADRILPIPKPTPDKETKIKILQKKNIYPEKKPEIKKEKIQITEDKVIDEIDDEAKKEAFAILKSLVDRIIDLDTALSTFFRYIVGFFSGYMKTSSLVS